MRHRLPRMGSNPWKGLGTGDRERIDDGFTLIEVIIVSLIVPIVVGAICLSLISVFTVSNGVSNRVSDSADSQTVSVNFEKDVQSAANLTTNSNSTATQCGTGTQLLGLEWNLNQASNVYETVVSYVDVQNGSTNSLVRQLCSAGPSATPSTSMTVSYNLQASQAAPTITCATAAASECTPTGTPSLAPYATSWVLASGISGVTWAIAEPENGSTYLYTLDGLPGASASTSAGSAVSGPTTTCGFATPNTGTYAATLCFVSFTPWNTQTGTSCTQPSGTTGLEMSAGIAFTPYTLTFCLSVSSVTSSGSSITGATTCAAGQVGVSDICAVPLPTYYNPPNSEAYLGNNGFYTGVPGSPALYTAQNASTATVTITNIQVLDAAGNPATGWELVTGDAESTDSGESITWTTNSGANLTILPNTSTSQIGNACAEPTTANPAAIYLTGVGTNSVKCAATVSSDKTGTVMLEAPTPTSLQVVLQAGGLQAMFLGVLLP
jgi:prepilin-type N-terminal cleavage/methylation domain-containing protein